MRYASYTTYQALRRSGSTADCAEGRRRISVTLKEETFYALRSSADASARSLSGEASAILTEALSGVEGDANPNIPELKSLAGKS
jgi:hypothetical protein